MNRGLFSIGHTDKPVVASGVCGETHPVREHVHGGARVRADFVGKGKGLSESIHADMVSWAKGGREHKVRTVKV